MLIWRGKEMDGNEFYFGDIICIVVEKLDVDSEMDI